MKWEAKGKWYIESIEGYRISRSINGDGFIFLSWPPNMKNDTHALGRDDNSNDAIKRCEEHYKATQK